MAGFDMALDSPKIEERLYTTCTATSVGELRASVSKRGLL
jgi:hypothetical protein